jgi:hypothetical protein
MYDDDADAQTEPTEPGEAEIDGGGSWVSLVCRHRYRSRRRPKGRAVRGRSGRSTGQLTAGPAEQGRADSDGR